jgi:sugar transferase (PEP-CTERM system associated)
MYWGTGCGLQRLRLAESVTLFTAAVADFFTLACKVMRLKLLGYYVHASIAALAAIEGALFLLAMFIAILARFGGDYQVIEAQIGDIWPRAALFGGATLVSFAAFGLYTSRQRARTLGLALRISVAVLAATAATAVVFYLVPALQVGRGVMAIAAVLAIGSACAARALFDRAVATDVFKRRVLVFGAGARAASLASLRRRSDRRGHVLIGFVRAPGEGVAVPVSQLLQDDVHLPQLCRQLNIDEVVVAMDDRRRDFPIAALLECRLAGLDVTELVSFLERETGRVRVDLLNPAWMIFGGGFNRDLMRRFNSRVLDIAASAIILVISLPAILLTAIAIKLEDGPRCDLFYRQPRVGYAGRTFGLLKFRSMRADAELNGQAVWAQKNDPRITRVGNLIRRLRIDELPQIFNVLRGHMSLVGPRPERPHFVDELAGKIPYYVQRHSVKPGITGWAQLCYPYGSSEHDALQKLQYDLYYIKNNSFLFDLAIILQTAEVVLMGKGAR